MLKWHGSPSPGAKPSHAFHFAVGLFPNLAQAVLIEENGDIQTVASRKRKVAAENGNIDRGGDGIVVALDRVDGSALHRAEQFAGRHQLIGEEQFDLHLPFRHLIESVDGRLDNMRRQRRAGVGLQPPLDRGFGLGVHGRGLGDGRADAGGCRAFQKIASIAHGGFLLGWPHCAVKNLLGDYAEKKPRRQIASPLK